MRQTENSQKWAVATQLGKFRRYTFVESFHIILEKYKLSWYVLKIQLTFQSFPFSLVLYFLCLSHLFILVLFHDFGINIVFQWIFTIVETPVGIQFLKVIYILQIKYPFQFVWMPPPNHLWWICFRSYRKRIRIWINLQTLLFQLQFDHL